MVMKRINCFNCGKEVSVESGNIYCNECYDECTRMDNNIIDNASEDSINRFLSGMLSATINDTTNKYKRWLKRKSQSAKISFFADVKWYFSDTFAKFYPNVDPRWLLKKIIHNAKNNGSYNRFDAKGH